LTGDVTCGVDTERTDEGDLYFYEIFVSFIKMFMKNMVLKINVLLLKKVPFL